MENALFVYAIMIIYRLKVFSVSLWLLFLKYLNLFAEISEILCLSVTSDFFCELNCFS
jgi:hypothetical protein